LINEYKLKEEEWENYAKLLEKIGDKNKYVNKGMGVGNFKKFVLECGDRGIKYISWKKS